MSNAQARACSSFDTLYALLEQSAARNPDAIAIEAPDRIPLTYRGLMEQCRLVTTCLHSSGLGRNDRVAIVLPNGPEMATAFLSFGGCVTTAPLNPGYRQAEFDFYLADLNARALVVQPGIDTPAIAAAQERSIPILTLSTTSSAEAGRFVLEGLLEGPQIADEVAQPDDIALVLHTSGTTSRPKIVPLTQANLCHSARTIAATLALSPADRCLNVMPLFHIHGLIAAVLSSLAAGGSAVCTPGFYAPRFFGWLEQFSPTWYTAVPTMHQAILTRAPDHAETIQRHSLRFVRSASSALPPVVMAELEAVFQAPALEAYGMTEGAHQIASNPLPPAARKPGSVGLAAGPEVEVMDSEGCLLSADVVGEIVVRGESITHGYENNPDANANAFAHGWFRTGDQGYIDSEGYIFLTGRIKEMINRGGEKIAPREIEEVLLDHTAVAQAVAFAVPHYRLGETVGAAVILREAGKVTPQALRLFLSDRLADFKIPETLLFLEEFPKGATGKLQRIGMAARLGVEPIDDSPPAERTDYAPPRTEEERLLTEIWEDVLGQSQIGIHDPFFHLGGDSMLATRLLSRLRDTLQIEIRFVEFFAHPTVAGLADLIDRRRGNTETAVPPLCTMQRDGDLPLSFAQERLWFLDQLEPGSIAYNQVCALRLHGTLDITALNQALTTIAQRHDSLRTTFIAVDGAPTQVILPPTTQPLDMTDLRSLSPDTREQEARRLAVAFTQQPYDLVHGPLWRTHLIRTEEQSHLLVIGLHHIVSDGWSRGVLCEELLALYAAFHSGEPSSLMPLPIQYPDFAVWQRSWLQGEALQAQRAYWMQQLADLPILDLPTDHPRPAVPTYRGDVRRLLLSLEQTHRLKELSRQAGATLYMTVLAAISVLLSRYSGQEDIVVGSPIANRNRSEIEGLIGFFANTLVLRTDVSGDPSFTELLQRVLQRTVEAYTHQDLPFEALVEALQPERHRDRNPLFQVMLVQHNPPLDGADSGRVRFSDEEVFCGASPFDLSVIFRERGAGLEFRCEYSTDLFDGTTIERMMGHFEMLLEAIVSNPQQKLSRLPLLTEPQRQQLLVEWNDTATGYPRDLCLHHLFEAQVERTPDAVALVHQNESLTYRQLNLRANQLAHTLQSRGVQPNTLVALCMNRSTDMVVGLLGTLKAGAAYVAIDPAYPPERIRYTLEDANAALILTQDALQPLLPQTQAAILCLDRERDRIEAQPADNPVSVTGPDDLAYVLYTSGSTGLPKGVAIEHHSPVALVSWALGQLSTEELSGVVFATSICFDLSVYELFVTLCGGGRVLLVENALAIAQLPSELAPTLINTVPSAMAELLRQGAVPRTVLRVNLAGEPLSGALVDEIYDQTQVRRVYDLYGPSEDTTYSTCALRDHGGAVTIGRPISNTQVYVLDRTGNPAPVGVPGELYIGGAGLAREYLGRPELTAEKFVKNPFVEEPGARLYRTGDLVRYLPDGNLEFVGRIDHQVKIRGFRVELGEIEAALNRHSKIRQSVVIALSDALQSKRLVAYLLTDGTALSIDKLREFLRQSLPTYMLPSGFVTLDALPLTSNGKVDRSALPVPRIERPEGEIGYREARTAVEAILVGIWSQVLGLEKVGIHDDFFALGGNSLSGARVISRIRTTLQVELPLRALFETLTIAQLAARLGSGRSVTAPPLTPVNRARPIPLSYVQEGLWFLDRLTPDRPFYSIPLLTRWSGPLDRAALQSALDALVCRHETLRTTFVLQDNRPVQAIHPPDRMPLTVIDLTNLPQAQQQAAVQQALTAETARPLDLRRGPLLRASLLCLAGQEHLFLLTVHHIVADGWSLEILQRELHAHYLAHFSGQPSLLMELPIQFADYAMWQRERLQGDVLETQLDYWRRQLDHLPTLDLPTDRPRPALPTFRGATQTVRLHPELMGKLKALSRQEGVTLFMTLLAAFNVLLARYSGQEDIVVGSPIAGRVRAELEPLIGMFANTLVLRTDLSGEPTFRQLLGRVRAMAIDAYAHQDVAFEKLVEALAPVRDPSRNPLFQVMFVLQNALQRVLELPGVTLRQEILSTQTSKFDLTLSVTQSDEGLRCQWEYSTDLFEASTLERMQRHFETLLEAIVSNPDRAISHVSLLTPPERQQLLVEWNDTTTEYPRDRCVHKLFEDQARRTPDATAVEFEGRHLTYAQLNARANQLAHRLIELGVGPEGRVGLCAERSLEMVVGVLGILKAGGAYVPIDRALPAQRAAFICRDACVAGVLTYGEVHDLLRDVEAPLLPMEADLSHLPTSNPDVATLPQCAAYVLYTSGSTGLPKGVVMIHSALVNLVCWQQRVLPAPARTLQFTSIGFDVSFQEFLTTWWGGGTLVLVSEESRRDLSGLLALMEAERIERLFVPFAVLQHLAGVGATVGTWPGSLREVITAGEPLQITSEIAAWFGSEGGPRLVNQYGPTEAHVVSSFGPESPVSAWSSLPPIGRPIANAQIHVLNKRFELVPVGAVGELYIGGRCLARGYLNRADMTAERFVPNPFGIEAGARLYRTGDLARCLPDGNIEFLGRIDHQVKIRGYRVELGEIESMLMAHPSVREAVALAWADLPGDRRLAAYIVACDGSVSSSELREHLRDKLPEYMIPSAFVMLGSLPLTSNGKVDRKALPAPQIGADANKHDVGPRTPVETQLAEIWREALGVERIGIHDNFFDLGGHSLLAARLFARIEERFGKRLPLTLLFHSPTIAAIAQHLQPQTSDTALWSCLVPIRAHGHKPPFFFVHAVGANLLDYRLLANHLGEDQPVYGFQALGLDGLQPPHTSVEAMASHYISEMRVVQPHGPYVLGGRSAGGMIAFEMARQLVAAREEVGLLALIDTYCRIALSPYAPPPDWKHGTWLYGLERHLGALLHSDKTVSGYVANWLFGKLKSLLPVRGSKVTEASETSLSPVLQQARASTRSALQAYEPKGYSGRITQFLARETFQRSSYDGRLGWSELAGGGLEIHFVAGNHNTMLEEPHVAELAAKLRNCR